MSVKNPDREALAHGRITNETIRPKPGIPSWALKLTMAITGLFFALFVVGHMAGNLKLYLPDENGVVHLDEYGAFLRDLGAPLIPHGHMLWIIRIVLLACVIAHIYGAFALTARSKAARGKFKRTNLMGLSLIHI